METKQTQTQTIKKEIAVYPKQRRFLESKALWRAFAAGIGSGKSFVGALDVIWRAKPERLYLVSAATYTMLSDATFRSFLDVGHQLEIIEEGSIKRSAPPSLRLKNGAEVLFRSADDPEMLRGPNLSGVWMDEAGLMRREAFDILIGRLREGGEQGWLTATFTPKGKVHWTYKVFGTGQPDTELVHAQSSENPFLPSNFVNAIRKQYGSQQAKQELGGLFIDEGGNHYFPGTWPRYVDFGDAYRIREGDRWWHIRKVECSRLLALDWAMGKPKKGTGGSELTGDHTAFVVADMSPDGLLLLLDTINERIPMGSNAPRLEEVCRRWNPHIVAGDNDNLSEAMLLETRRYDIPTVRCLPLGGKNKLVRSQAAIVRAERGQVYLPEKNEPWVGVLTDQLTAFTGADGEPDDIADAVSILGRLADEFVPGEQYGYYEPALGDGYMIDPGYLREQLDRYSEVEAEGIPPHLGYDGSLYRWTSD